MQIAGVPIGQTCRVVAEISGNHNGDYEKCLDLIGGAFDAGADILKLQCYHPRELIDLRGNGPAPKPWHNMTMRQLYEKARTPFDWFPRIATFCQREGIPWFSSVFGLGGFALLEALGCPAYKIASLDSSKLSLRRMVEGAGKPIVRSLASVRPPDSSGVYLHCPPGYPQDRIDLGAFKRGYTGLSYHGTDWLHPLIAAAYGAKLLEVHVQLDDEPSDLESNVSLTVTQLGKLTEGVKRVAKIC